MEEEAIVMHFVTPDTNGAIHTGSAGVSGEMAASGLFPKQGRLRFACDPSGKAVQTYFHRATGVAHKMAGGQYIVKCPKCLESPEFKAAAAEAEEANSPKAMFDANGKRCC